MCKAEFHKNWTRSGKFGSHTQVGWVTAACNICSFLHRHLHSHAQAHLCHCLKKAVTLQIQRHHMLEFTRLKHYKPQGTSVQMFIYPESQGTSVQMYSYPEQKLWRELHGGFYIFTIECIFWVTHNYKQIHERKRNHFNFFYNSMWTTCI